MLFSDILLTVDFDHTLTAPDGSIPERNLAAIRYFMENGGAFTMNTGRSLPMIRHMTRLIPTNAPLLLYNGSAAYDLTTEQMLFSYPIQLDTWETVNKIRQLLPDLTLELQGTDAHYCFKKDPAWDAFCDYQHCDKRLAEPGEDLGPFLKLALFGEFRDASISSLYDATEEELRQMDEAERLLCEHFGDQCIVYRACARILDIHAKGVSKANAARKLQQQLGRKWLVCVGDGENDVAMLQAADFAYAPADGVVADRFETVCDCKNGAVADVSYEKIPEILKI